jgi:hypothetical protein
MLTKCILAPTNAQMHMQSLWTPSRYFVWETDLSRTHVETWPQLNRYFSLLMKHPRMKHGFFRENVTALQNMWLILVTNLLKAAGYESFVFFKDF